MKDAKQEIPKEGMETGSDGNRGLWLALVGGGIAWMFHLLLSVLVAEFGCVAGLGEVRFLGINLVAWLLLLVALLALGGGMIATVFSYRLEKRERSGGARKFSARTALIANLIFVFVILMQSVPIFYFLHDC